MKRPPIVASYDDARAHHRSVSVLIEVPSELVPTVVWLVEMLQKPASNPVTQVVKTLLKRREQRT